MHNLRAHKLVVDTLCPICRAEEETVSHLFRDCTFTQQVQRELGVTNSTTNRESNWKKWLALEFENYSNEACKIRAISFWALWYNCNRISHEGIRERAHEIVRFINAYYSEITQMGEILKNRQETKRFVWEPPVDDAVKINFDASFNQHSRRSCSLVIARNKEGLVMASCTYSWENISDPVIAEAMACLQAVTMAEEIGFQDICVEGDALTVIRKLNSTKEDRSCISSMIQEINGRTPNFRRMCFRFVPREANKAVHGMAMEGWRYDNPLYWMEEVPRAVEGLVNCDRSGRDDGG
ncbi:uncharacterized protein [Gossypium hirsutum]|uniref:RNase H type-1 domain-containing protein n=1 Tax=Gossypium hirsutum TaxID=3635 RepID=A0A1U8JJX9_GOSHI|nr:uncharacterized protein LOC107907782 [Gossypium hirsutum]